MKNILVLGIAVFLCASGLSQSGDWKNKDLIKDSVFGISTEKAYDELLPNRKSVTVSVAVIDAGIDTDHEDLKDVIWTNHRERLNGKDDDHNGYIDDIHGWNFIGSRSGNVQYDNVELVRVIRRDKDFYDSLSLCTVPVKYRSGYMRFKRMKAEYYWSLENAMIENAENSDEVHVLVNVGQKAAGGKPTLADFEAYHPIGAVEIQLRNAMIAQLRAGVAYEDLEKMVYDNYNNSKARVDYHLNIKYDPRSIVGDNYNDNQERRYGNGNVTGPDASHGTLVSGIIGAIRKNNIGVDGIANDVRIMCIRAVPDGDERDKDIANAIRYAVDNGARIINMSFGKSFSWDKKIVDDAVKYAARKDVLIVHAAGNDRKNLDNDSIFPNRRYADSSGQAKAWIEVGASSAFDDLKLAAFYSNYGKTTVDLFAPGVHIYSTTPGTTYKYADGTSMAAPVVTGVAALIREYYPKLTAVQVKEIIMKSVVKRDVLKDKCVSGGVVNAYNALKLAATYK